MSFINIENLHQESIRLVQENDKIIQESINYNTRLGEVLSGSSLALAEEDDIEVDENGVEFRTQRNIVLTSETQNGKTGTILDIVKNSPDKTLNVLSCDNKTDQMDQISSRMKNNDIDHLFVRDIKLNTSGSLTKKSFKLLKETFEKDKKLVLLLLNNESQCKKLSEAVKELFSNFNFNRYQIIHDEADLINKSDETKVIIDDNIAKIHKTWISHFNDIRVFTNIKYIKRIWVSATPENCALIHNIKAKDLFVLPTTLKYKGQTEFEDWNNDFTRVKYEVDRVINIASKEVILYCTSRLNSEHSKLSKDLSEYTKAPTITYNGQGINLYRNGFLQEESYNNISDALAKLEEDYNGPIIVVGHALMSRGISFVSSKKSVKPLTATVMFYEGSSSIHAVGIAQRIGRITGTSRPDITRRKLYCNRGIMTCYNDYLENQKKMFSTFNEEGNKEKYICDIIRDNDLELEELERDLDRSSLPKANKDYKECSSRSRSPTPTSNFTDADNIKMEKSVKRWKDPKATSGISKIFKKILYSPGSKVEYNTLKDYIDSVGKSKTFIGNLYTVNHSSKMHVVFELVEGYVCARQEAVDFANTL